MRRAAGESPQQPSPAHPRVPRVTSGLSPLNQLPGRAARVLVTGAHNCRRARPSEPHGGARAPVGYAAGPMRIPTPVIQRVHANGPSG